MLREISQAHSARDKRACFIRMAGVEQDLWNNLPLDSTKNKAWAKNKQCENLRERRSNWNRHMKKGKRKFETGPSKCAKLNQRPVQPWPTKRMRIKQEIYF